MEYRVSESSSCMRRTAGRAEPTGEDENEGIEMTEATTTPAATADRGRPPKLAVGSGLMTLAGVAFIGYAIWFFIRNFSDDFLELGIGAEQVNVGKTQIEQFSPSLYDYISHLHIAVAGFVAATGLATALLAWFGVRRGYLWAWASAVAVPVLGLAVALPSHYPYGFDTIGHLGLIYLATAIFVVGALIALPAVLEANRRPAGR
jgi:cytochrome bd-type quinol oxidase subunit 2